MRREFDLGFAPLSGGMPDTSNLELIYSALTDADVKRLYPGFDAWFSSQVIPGMRRGERRIITSFVNGAPAGVAICKRSNAEAKLCTLWVAPEARGLGIAAELANRAFAWLGTAKPLFTVPGERLAEFRALLNEWSFSDHAEVLGMYRPGRVEHVFNCSKH